MKLLKSTFSFIAMTAAAAPALAHPGHDHGHWSSAAVHSAFAISIIMAAVALFVGYRAYKRKQASKK